MKEFAEGLQANVLDRPVLDQTGLSGRFDFTLSWTPDEFQFPNVDVKAPPADNNAGLPDLLTALKDQLGLKLESTKGSVEIFIIDKLDKPSAN